MIGTLFQKIIGIVTEDQGVEVGEWTRTFIEMSSFYQKNLKKLISIKGKDYEWIKNPYFNEILVKIKNQKTSSFWMIK